MSLKRRKGRRTTNEIRDIADVTFCNNTSLINWNKKFKATIKGGRCEVCEQAEQPIMAW